MARKARRDGWEAILDDVTQGAVLLTIVGAILPFFVPKMVWMPIIGLGAAWLWGFAFFEAYKRREKRAIDAAEAESLLRVTAPLLVQQPSAWDDANRAPTTRGERVPLTTQAHAANFLHAYEYAYDIDPYVCGVRPALSVPEFGLAILCARFDTEDERRTRAVARRAFLAADLTTVEIPPDAEAGTIERMLTEALAKLDKGFKKRAKRVAKGLTPNRDAGTSRTSEDPTRP